MRVSEERLMNMENRFSDLVKMYRTCTKHDWVSRLSVPVVGGYIEELIRHGTS